MPSATPPVVRNRLLSALSAADLALLRPHLTPVDLPRGQVLLEAGAAISHIDFPETAIASIVAETGDGRRLEVGIFGREGMSGTRLLLGIERNLHECFIQVAGDGLRMPASALLNAFALSPSLRAALLRFVEVLAVQTAHTAVANGSFTIEQRLARWLLMCHDRIDGDELALTHEFLAIMLGVRRSGVTVAVQVLEGGRIIQAERGRITIRDRRRLEEVAEASYGTPEAEYERLIGPFR